MLKKVLISFLVIAAATRATWAAELHCAYDKPSDPRQRGIVVDCSNPDDVTHKLLSAWLLLRESHVGLIFEDMCWRPYKQAQDIHPIVDPRDWAPGFLRRCNAALRYVR